jgi:hypothetical protein
MTLVQYLVPCLTENELIKTGYRLSLPTSCPTNSTHEINKNGIVVINTQGFHNMKINQDSGIENGEHFRVDSFLMNISNDIESYDISYLYNIEIFSIFLHISSNNLGDELNIFTNPNEEVGFIIEDITNNTFYFKVNSVQFLNPGFLLSISDDENINDLGEIINIDKDNNIVEFSKPTMNKFSSGSKILITICRVKNFIFNKVSNFQLGLSRLGSSGLKSGNIIRLIYKNNNKSPKTFSLSAEIQY